jgi:hypothetical protein
MATAKDVLADILAHQPDDSTYTELVRELAFSVMVQQGLTDSDNDKVISNEEMHKRIRSWQS